MRCTELQRFCDRSHGCMGAIASCSSLVRPRLRTGRAGKFRRRQAAYTGWDWTQDEQGATGHLGTERITITAVGYCSEASNKIKHIITFRPATDLEERGIRVFKNRVLRRIYEPQRDDVTVEWRKLHNEELNDLYSSPSIIRVMKSRRMRLAGHVACMGERRGVYRVLVGKPEGNKHL